VPEGLCDLLHQIRPKPRECLNPWIGFMQIVSFENCLFPCTLPGLIKSLSDGSFHTSRMQGSPKQRVTLVR